MAITTHFGGGISTPMANVQNLSNSGGTFRASTMKATTKFSGATMHATTKLSGAGLNLRTAIRSGKTGNGNIAVTGLAVGDIILSQAAYFRFSDSAMKTTGNATVKIKSAGFVSVTGIVSNSIIMFNWMPY